MADKAATKQKLHIALTQRHFLRDWSKPSEFVYKGILDPSNLRIPISIKIADMDFVKYPKIYIDQDYDFQDRIIPHIEGDDRALCYMASGSVVLDRYNPGGTILQCLEQADRVIRNAFRERSTIDIAEEFHSYWGDYHVYVDLPTNFMGYARLQIYEKGTKKAALLSQQTSWLSETFKKIFSSDIHYYDCLIVKAETILTLNPSASWPPKNLNDLNKWLNWVHPKLIGLLENSFMNIGSNYRWICVKAQNGIFIYGAKLPSILNKPEFTKNRRANLPKQLKAFANHVEIIKLSGDPADTKYIFNRNMGNMNNLSGKKILLVGCGTIGSFVAHQLAMAGAGSEDGRLTLADPDVLSTANLGRHLLGTPYLNSNKAEGCKEFLKFQLPMLDVVSHARDARELLTASVPFDIIIDTTGEEALSLAINQLAVNGRPNWPPVIFGYLIGNGSAAQALIVEGPEHACLKCLKPKLSEKPRFQSQRPSINIEKITNYECSDPLYIPFPVSRSVGAASMISDMVIDWANGNIKNRFRNTLFDTKKAFFIKDSTPSTSKNCPACAPEI